MKSLPTLIRLKQQTLDEKRRALAQLETEAMSISARIGELEREAAGEAEAARRDAEASYGYGNYIAAVRVRRSGLEAELAAVDKRIAAARDTVAEAYREMKRFELAQAFAARRAAAAATKREQAVLDEVGLSGYRRAKARNCG